MEGNSFRWFKAESLNYNQVGFLDYNEKVMITAAVEADGYLWGKKAEYYGKTGWCTLDYAERISNQEIGEDSLKGYLYLQKS